VSLAALANGRLFKYSELSGLERLLCPRARVRSSSTSLSKERESACRVLYGDLNIRSTSAGPHGAGGGERVKFRYFPGSRGQDRRRLLQTVDLRASILHRERQNDEENGN